MSDFLSGPSPTDHSPDFQWPPQATPPTAPIAQPPVDEPPAQAPKNGHPKRVIGMLIGAGLLIGATVVGAFALTGGEASPLKNAPLGGLTTFVQDHTDDAMTLDMDYSAGDDMTYTETETALDRLDQDQQDLKTLLEYLGFSPATYDRMQHTRALDGTQHADSVNQKMTAYWTYHPDDGLQVTFERKK